MDVKYLIIAVPLHMSFPFIVIVFLGEDIPTFILTQGKQGCNCLINCLQTHSWWREELRVEPGLCDWLLLKFLSSGKTKEHLSHLLRSQWETEAWFWHTSLWRITTSIGFSYRALMMGYLKVCGYSSPSYGCTQPRLPHPL